MYHVDSKGRTTHLSQAALEHYRAQGYKVPRSTASIFWWKDSQDAARDVGYTAVRCERFFAS